VHLSKRGSVIVKSCPTGASENRAIDLDQDLLKGKTAEDCADAPDIII